MSNDPAYDPEQVYWPNRVPPVIGVDPEVSQDPHLFDDEGGDS